MTEEYKTMDTDDDEQWTAVNNVIWTNVIANIHRRKAPSEEELYDKFRPTDVERHNRRSKHYTFYSHFE